MVQGTRRYDRLAEQYSQYRPRYPDQLISHLADIIAKAPASNLVVDVGSGTGIFTRQLRAALPDAVAGLPAHRPTRVRDQSSRFPAGWAIQPGWRATSR